MKLQRFIALSIVLGLAQIFLHGCAKISPEKADLYLSSPQTPREARSAAPKKKTYQTSTGTGFFVTSDGVLITNHHVIEGAKHIAIYYKNDFIDANLLATDPGNDLAILKVSIPSRPAPLAALFREARGEEVFTLGYPISNIQGIEQKASFGRINATTGYRDDMRHVQVDIPVHPGNSGGPLINARGEIIGVISSGLSAQLLKQGIIPQNVGYAVKVDYLWPLFRQVGVKPTGRARKEALNMPSLVSLLENSVVQIYTLR